MIDRKLQPLEWADFMYELTDAVEHLGKLVKDIDRTPDYDQDAFRIDLGHVYAHLNRAWSNSKGDTEETIGREAISAFPVDLTPIG
jgi:hypothetical protein